MSDKPAIYIPTDNQGYHNNNPELTKERLKKAKSYADQSTIIVCPTRGLIPARVVSSFLSIIKPMNQKVVGPIFMEKMEVGEAYNQVIENVILANPELAKFKYLLTIEEDNLVPPNILTQLLQDIEDFDAVGSLYWTKGEGGQPMSYGNPMNPPLNFIPFNPPANSVTPVNGLGMGATLFRMSMFTEGKISKPFFKTCNDYDPVNGTKVYTQDLYFFENACRAGYRMGVSTKVLTGHLDYESGIVW